jgi:hypothetical protein
MSGDYIHVPIHPQINTDSQFSLRAILLMWKIGEKKAPIRCLEVKSTHLSIKDIVIVTQLLWLLAPLIKQCLDAQDSEQRIELV